MPICVQGYYDPATNRIKTRCESSRLAEIPAEPNHAYLWVLSMKLNHYLKATVCAAVIDEYDFVAQRQGIQNGNYFLDQGLQVVDFVQHGNDQTQVEGFDVFLVVLSGYGPVRCF